MVVLPGTALLYLDIYDVKVFFKITNNSFLYLKCNGLEVIYPGCAVGYKNWLRITIAVAPSSLEDGLDRLKCFCARYSKLNK